MCQLTYAHQPYGVPISRKLAAHPTSPPAQCLQAPQHAGKRTLHAGSHPELRRLMEGRYLGHREPHHLRLRIPCMLPRTSQAAEGLCDSLLCKHIRSWGPSQALLARTPVDLDRPHALWCCGECQKPPSFLSSGCSEESCRERQLSLLAPENEGPWRFCSALPFLPGCFGCSVSLQSEEGFLVASIPAAFVKVAAVWEGAGGLHPLQSPLCRNCQYEALSTSWVRI